MTRLEEIIKQITNKHVFIQTHNIPDPDAISSAFGLQSLLRSEGVEATICYKGEIDRYNTLKLIEVLGISLENLSDMGCDVTEDDEVILVDAQMGNSNITNVAGDKIICIDHHPTYEKVCYRYADIRPKIGACASIIAQYFVESGIPMDVKAATALSYGIRCDTDRLSRGTSKLDMEMLYQLYEKSDNGIIKMLEGRELYFNDLMAYSKAIESIEVYDDISFASTGEDCPEALIASVSDFMLALVEVEFSVVYSIRKDGIKLSVRSKTLEYDAGRITSRALNGIGSGGGHPNMAGGMIPAESSEGSSKELLHLLRERFLKELKVRG